MLKSTQVIVASNNSKSARSEDATRTGIMMKLERVGTTYGSRLIMACQVACCLTKFSVEMKEQISVHVMRTEVHAWRQTRPKTKFRWAEARHDRILPDSVSPYQILCYLNLLSGQIKVSFKVLAHHHNCGHDELRESILKTWLSLHS